MEDDVGLGMDGGWKMVATGGRLKQGEKEEGLKPVFHGQICSMNRWHSNEKTSLVQAR